MKYLLSVVLLLQAISVHAQQYEIRTTWSGMMLGHKRMCRGVGPPLPSLRPVGPGGCYLGRYCLIEGAEIRCGRHRISYQVSTSPDGGLLTRGGFALAHPFRACSLTAIETTGVTIPTSPSGAFFGDGGYVETLSAGAECYRSGPGTGVLDAVYPAGSIQLRRVKGPTFCIKRHGRFRCKPIPWWWVP